MEFAAERAFVERYIRKGRRDRLLHELTHPGKRYAGLSRFCHQAEDLLDRGLVRCSGPDLFRQDLMLRLLAEHGGEDCALLSPDPLLDGLTVPLAQAARLAEACPDAVILLARRFAVVQEEAMKGGRARFLLCEPAGLR